MKPVAKTLLFLRPQAWAVLKTRWSPPSCFSAFHVFVIFFPQRLLLKTILWRWHHLDNFSMPSFSTRQAQDPLDTWSGLSMHPTCASHGTCGFGRASFSWILCGARKIWVFRSLSFLEKASSQFFLTKPLLHSFLGVLGWWERFGNGFVLCGCFVWAKLRLFLVTFFNVLWKFQVGADGWIQLKPLVLLLCPTNLLTH